MSTQIESLEWQSVLQTVVKTDLRTVLPQIGSAGVIAYTDGACLKNPGGPAGWSCLLWSATDAVKGIVRADAPCCEQYGHIPKSKTTTNNRAEIAAVLAVLSLAPPALPLTIYSDSEYTIKVASGIYQMKANPDLWEIYRTLSGYRKQAPKFEWVRGHAGQLHNERADELAGLGAWNNDRAAYERWQASDTPEAHNPAPARPRNQASQGQGAGVASAEEVQGMRQSVQRLKTYMDSIAVESGRISEPERKFINDMARRFQKNSFVPSDKQSNWIKGLIQKYKVV
ncbi:ribonuclease HI [Tengunoibacter tsumagoiensis]|uniref:ribonuclease H n=1 Tax=Tengunoibacter tsumagoiensis TaxID=2014871 RepID=A0A401ZZP1_9CHLR|nr:RNase H family protein [Tengunoibacter tsumagoiensis]GCE12338.1 hypothetical protein KTT_21970 [Tengunoibacter tsumagoiensis]